MSDLPPGRKKNRCPIPTMTPFPTYPTCESRTRTGRSLNRACILFPHRRTLRPTSTTPTPSKIHLAVKIYKTSILTFKDRDRYAMGEHCFRRGYSRDPRGRSGCGLKDAELLIPSSQPDLYPPTPRASPHASQNVPRTQTRPLRFFRIQCPLSRLPPLHHQ